MSEVRPSERHNHTRVITISSEDGRPVLDSRAYRRQARMLRDAADDDTVRVVVLRGLAGCFCLGGDLSEFLDTAQHGGLIAAVTDLFRTLATFPKPIIGCVDGDAVGVGCTILFHCDLVVASRASTFRVPFVDLGLVPDAATSLLAPLKLGYAGAFRFFCLGDMLGTAEARDLGLVSEVVEDGEAEDAALAIAHRLSRKPAEALVRTRDLLRGNTGKLCARIDEEISLFHQALQNEATLKRLKRIARLAA